MGGRIERLRDAVHGVRGGAILDRQTPRRLAVLLDDRRCSRRDGEDIVGFRIDADVTGEAGVDAPVEVLVDILRAARDGVTLRGRALGDGGWLRRNRWNGEQRQRGGLLWLWSMWRHCQNESH